MRIVRENDKVEILRNKRKGLKLIAVIEGDPSLFSCQNDCYLWNHPLCGKKPCGKLGLWGCYHFIRYDKF